MEDLSEPLTWVKILNTVAYCVKKNAKVSGIFSAITSFYSRSLLHLLVFKNRSFFKVDFIKNPILKLSGRCLCPHYDLVFFLLCRETWRQRGQICQQTSAVTERVQTEFNPKNSILNKLTVKTDFCHFFNHY